MAGRDGLDPRQADVPADLPDYTGALARGVKGLRIGVLAEASASPAVTAPLTTP
jgi:Asp-tRNA(Asn)/Glu-tRNA(Gln) amidotransferase A subunit family amidase